MNARGRPTQPSRGLFAALFLVSASLLLWETLLTRIYSALFHYHFAFMAVSIAMFGMTAGAVAVMLEGSRLDSRRLPHAMALLALAAGLAMAAAISAQLAIPLDLGAAGNERRYLLCSFALSALPFLPAGAFVCLALTRFTRVGPLYAIDLAGASCACLLLAVALPLLGGPGAAVAAGALCCAAAYPLLRTKNRRGTAAVLACAVGLGALAAGNARGQWLRVRWSPVGAIPKPLYERWNLFSRVLVTHYPEGRPFVWGVAGDLLQRAPPVDQLMLVIDSGSATPITRWKGGAKGFEYLTQDITAFAHHLRKEADVLIIGPGGGRDVLTALVFGQKSVKAIEVNGNVLRAVNRDLGEFSGHLDRVPGVSFIEDEGRSYLERSSDRFDIIQASLVDTGAATAGGAYALVENGLYTVEAWRLFLSRLKPRGILTVSRGVAEMHRAAILARQALLQLGIADPARHVIIARFLPNRAGGLGIATILVSPDPFSAADLSRARAACRELGCAPALATPSPEELRGFPFDASPPTDDRPFFFFTARMSEILSGGHDPVVGALRSLALWSLALALSLTLLPPVWMVWHGRWRGQAAAGSQSLPAYFGLIGLAFMFIEIGLIQRLSLFLGHPTLGFTVALFSILLISGAGSLASRSMSAAWPAAGPSWPLFALLLALLFALRSSAAATALWLGAPTAVRVTLSALIVAPAAFFMGCAFPLGMALVDDSQDGRGAWYWAINGAASVVASVLAMICSLGWGISRTLWLGVLCYSAAALLHRHRAQGRPIL